MQNGWHQREEVFNSVRRCFKRQESELLREYELRFDGLVDRQEDVEFKYRSAKEFSVLHATPAHPSNRSDLVAYELAGELNRNILIEKNAHWRVELRELARERRWPATG